MKMSRREFFNKTLQGLLVISIPGVLIQSCKDNSTGPSVTPSDMSTIEAAESNGIVTVPITSSSPLFAAGSAAIVSYTSGSIMVDHPSENTFNALTRTCTHQGCIISSFDKTSKQFICTCHGSRFDQNGGVSQGPANSPLTKYQTDFQNNILTIKIN